MNSYPGPTTRFFEREGGFLESALGGEGEEGGGGGGRDDDDLAREKDGVRSVRSGRCCCCSKKDVGTGHGFPLVKKTLEKFFQSAFELIGT